MNTFCTHIVPLQLVPVDRALIKHSAANQRIPTKAKKSTWLRHLPWQISSALTGPRTFPPLLTW